MTTPKIYIGSYDINHPLAFGEEHTYLFYDPDTDGDNDPTTGTDMRIIRGGPNGGSPNLVAIQVEDWDVSADRFDNGDGTTDTPEDRNFRVISEGSEASSIWADMESVAADMGTYDSASGTYISNIGYLSIGANSNSVINSVMSAVGIDFRNNTPYSDSYPYGTVYQNPAEYPGHMELIDGIGDTILMAYSYSSDHTFHDQSGNDYFIVENGAVADVTKDTDASSWNNIVLSGYSSLNDLWLAQEGDDLELRDDPGILFNDIVDIEDHFSGVNGFNTKYLFVVDGNVSADDINTSNDTISGTGLTVLKQIDTRLLSNYNLFGSVKLSNIWTSLSTGDDFHGTSEDEFGFGDDSDNELSGGSGNDRLYGGAGNDSINFNVGNSSYLSYADGEGGTDFFSISGGAESGYSDLLLNGSTIISQNGIAENFEGVKTVGSEMIYIESLGWTFDIQNNVVQGMDYSAISQSLEFVFDNATSWSVNETQGMAPSSDTYINIGSSSPSQLWCGKFIGTNYGDTFTFSNVEFHPGLGVRPQLELGTGDDTVDIYMNSGNDTEFEFTYTDGDDTINFIGTNAFNVAEQADIFMAVGIVESDINFIKNNIALESITTSYTRYSFDLVIEVSGKGNIAVDNLSYLHYKGSDGIYGTSDDFYRHYAPTVRLAGSGTGNTLFNTHGSSSEPGSGNFEFIPGPNIPWKGTAQNDILTGNSSANNLYGYGGNDIINGEAGNDKLYGYGGDDTISGGDGSDQIHGGLGNDILYGNDGNDILYGNQGDDTLRGGQGNDTLRGENDNDTLMGSFGDDYLYGGFGNDTLRGEEDDDNLYGGDGQDDARGGSGADIIYGDAGNDRLEGNDGNDTLYGGADSDNDIGGFSGGLFGGNGDDILYGEAGSDRLYGENDNDILYGGADTDALRGGAGNDILFGEGGNDNLWGEAGADTFSWLVSDVGNGVDDVKDFSLLDGDMLDVSDILSANYDPLTDAITDFIQITDDGTHSRLYADADGGADNFIYVALVRSVIGLTDEAALELNGTLITV